MNPVSRIAALAALAVLFLLSCPAVPGGKNQPPADIIEIEEPPPAGLLGKVLILQAYGTGDKNDGGVSHSFIELYNPTEEAVDLSGWSLQLVGEGTIKTATGNNWQVLPLSGTIPAKTSFLIRANGNSNGGPITGARYTIGDVLEKFAIFDEDCCEFTRN